VGKAEGRYAAVVFDTNVVIAALIRERGFNRYVVSLAPILYPSFYPIDLKREIREHAERVVKKAGRSEYELQLALQAMLRHAKLIPEEKVKKYLSEAERFVKDPEDAAYIAAALYLRSEEGFKQVILVTWNKRDFDFWQLVGRWVRVLDPREFYTNYLRPFLSPAPIQCLLCKVDSLNKAIKATLLHIGERQYLVVDAKPPDRIEIETPCYIVLIEWDNREKAYCISPQRLDIRECTEKIQQPMTAKRLQEIESARRICKP